MHRTLAILALVLVAGASTPTAQADRFQRKTGAPPESRFEVVEAWGREMLRLDKATGQVWQLGRSETLLQNAQAWRPIPRPEEPVGPTADVNYQLISHESSPVMLLNVNTGATWTLRREDRQARWLPVGVERE